LLSFVARSTACLKKKESEKILVQTATQSLGMKKKWYHKELLRKLEDSY
jgi:hypothetical protein